MVTRSARPQLSMKVSSCTPEKNIFANLAVSLRPIRMMAALVLPPRPRPSQKPAPSATMFLSAPHSSTPATSLMVPMRKVGQSKSFWKTSPLALLLKPTVDSQNSSWATARHGAARWQGRPRAPPSRGEHATARARLRPSSAPPPPPPPPPQPPPSPTPTQPRTRPAPVRTFVGDVGAHEDGDVHAVHVLLDEVGDEHGATVLELDALAHTHRGPVTLCGAVRCCAVLCGAVRCCAVLWSPKRRRRTLMSETARQPLAMPVIWGQIRPRNCHEVCSTERRSTAAGGGAAAQVGWAPWVAREKGGIHITW